MFCKKCGRKLPDNAKFCPGCGLSVEQKATTDKMENKSSAVQSLRENMDGDMKDNPSKKRKSGRIAIVILGMVVIVVAGIILLQKRSYSSYDEYLAEAQQYLAELKYEEAEAVLNQAINTEPEKKEAYIFLAEVYEKDNKKKDAVQTLKKGLEGAKLQEGEQKEIQRYIQNVQDGVDMKSASEIESQEEETKSLEQEEVALTDYIKDTLIPEEGKVEEADETGKYKMSGDVLEDEQRKLLIDDGIAASFIKDMDDDGQKELHVLRSESVFEDSSYYNQIFWEIYALEGENVKKIDSQMILKYQSVYADEVCNVYLKKNGDQWYIYSEADGVSIGTKMDRSQNFFEFTGGKIRTVESMITTGGNGGLADIYQSDSEYLSYISKWVNGASEKNESAEEYYVYGDGAKYSDFDSYLEGYPTALEMKLSKYGVSMPEGEMPDGQYPFYDIYLADAASLDENIFSYQLKSDESVFDETVNNEELEYTKTIKGIQIDAEESSI